MEEEDAEQSLNSNHLINTGEEPIVVTALQLYKLMSALIESVPQLESHKSDKTGNSEATGQVEHALQEGGRRPVQDAVTAAWSLPDDQHCIYNITLIRILVHQLIFVARDRKDGKRIS